MTKVKLKDATKELLKGAEDMLGSVSTSRQPPARWKISFAGRRSSAVRRRSRPSSSAC